MLHWMAWERGVKSLYYCRSKSVQRAGFAGEDNKADIDRVERRRRRRRTTRNAWRASRYASPAPRAA